MLKTVIILCHRLLGHRLLQQDLSLRKLSMTILIASIFGIRYLGTGE